MTDRLIGFALVLMLAAGAGAQSVVQRRVFDVRPLIANVTEPQIPVVLPLEASFSGAGVPADSEAAAVIAPDSLTDAVRAVLSPGGEADATMGVDLRGDHLSVQGSAEAIARVAAFLEALARQILPSIAVEVAEVGGAALPGPLLAPAEIDALLATNPARFARALLIDGRAGRLRSGRDTSFIGDYDVEVAQAAAIANPVIRVLHEGFDLVAQARTALDGRLSVRVAGTDAALAAPLTPRPLDAAGLGVVQLPIVRSEGFVTSGVIEDGGGIVVAAGTGTRIVVRFRRTAPLAPGILAQNQQLVASADLGGGSWRHPIVITPGVRRSGETEVTTQFLPDGDSSSNDDRLNEMVRASLARAAAAGPTFEVGRERILIRGTEADAQRVRDALAPLAAFHGRTAAIEFRSGRLPLADALALSAGRLAPADAAPRLDREAAVAARLGDQFKVAGGTEQALVVDYEPEIAEKSQISDPVIAPLFLGDLFDGAVSDAGGGRLILSLLYRIQRAAGEKPPGPVPTGAPVVGAVDLPQLLVNSGTLTVPVESGKWAVLLIGSTTEHDDPLVVLVKVSLR